MSRDTEHADAAAQRRPRFFGRRRGKGLRRGALGLIDDMLPGLEVILPESGDLLNPALMFPGAMRSLWLEVGFGGGEHLADQAEAHPEVGVIGCEVFRNGVASLLGHVAGRGLGNVRIFPEDVRLLLPALPDASLGRVFVLFPDPWPKTRHTERRFINRDTLDVLARLLEDKGELRVASDDPVYVAWAARLLDEHPAFEKMLATADRSQVPEDWPATRYERKCITGRAPVFFLYRRRAR